MRKKQGAFTLLEIMLVVTIIALLLAAAIKFMSPNVDIAKRVRVTGDIQAIKTSLLAYQGINGFYPTTEQGLQALVTAPSTDPRPARLVGRREGRNRGRLYVRLRRLRHPGREERRLRLQCVHLRLVRILQRL